MKPDLRISIKDYQRNKTLHIQLSRTPFSARQFFVRIDRRRWPSDGRPASLTKVLANLRKALVKATAQG